MSKFFGELSREYSCLMLAQYDQLFTLVYRVHFGRRKLSFLAILL